MSSPNDFDKDDDEIAELLRQTGTRAEPPQAMMREVQAAVHAEWQSVVAAHRRRRRTLVWSAAAAVGAFALATTIGLQLLDTQGEPIATLQLADGAIFRASGDTEWSPIRAGQRIAVGDSVRSDARAAVHLDNGLALRIDRGTTFKLVSDERLALSAGALYVDAAPGTSSDAFTVETHSGAVRHLGTQYQVRMQPDGIDVAVREGRVMIESEASTAIARAGEQLTISTRGSVQRSSIGSSDAQWQWASEIAPPFAIENASLAAFLSWISRETGRRLVYESAAVQSTAANVTLHGSIDGLTPDVAISAVLATTPLRRDEAKTEVLSIVPATSIDSASGRRPTP